MDIDGILRYFPKKVQELIKDNINNEELEVLEEMRVRNNLPTYSKIQS